MAQSEGEGRGLPAQLKTITGTNACTRTQKRHNIAYIVTPQRAASHHRVPDGFPDLASGKSERAH